MNDHDYLARLQQLTDCVSDKDATLDEVRLALEVCLGGQILELRFERLKYGTNEYTAWITTKEIPNSARPELTWRKKQWPQDGTGSIGQLVVTSFGDLNSHANQFLNSIASLLNLYLERSVRNDDFKALSAIDVWAPSEQLLPQLLKYTLNISEMFCVVLRKFNTKDRSFQCIGEAGLSLSDDELVNLDIINPPLDYLYAMIANEPYVANNSKDLPGFSEYGRLRFVTSFAAFPIHYKGTLYGSVHLGSLSPHNYEQDEVEFLYGISHQLSQLLLAHLVLDQVRRDQWASVEQQVAISMVELAQMARHQVVDHVTELSESLRILDNSRRKIEDIPTPKGNLHKLITEFSQLAESALADLRKMKAFTEWPGQTKTDYSLVEIVQKATDALDFRLNPSVLSSEGRGRIYVEIAGSANILVRVVPELVRYCFISLLINSVEAFDSRSKKTRRIDIRVSDPGPKEKYVEVEYTDTAGGIDVGNLKDSRGKRILIPEAIFMPGVSSKEDSSGHGMAIARNIMSLHEGSIDLVESESNAGVRFILKFRKLGRI